MKRVIVLLLLILAVTMGAATAETYRITNYGGGWNPVNWVSNGYTTISAQGDTFSTSYYRDPTRSYFVGSQNDGYSWTMATQRPIQTVYRSNEYGPYRTVEYGTYNAQTGTYDGSSRLTQLNVRTPYGAINTQYNPVTRYDPATGTYSGSYSGSGWVGSPTGGSYYRPTTYSGGWGSGVYSTTQLSPTYSARSYSYPQTYRTTGSTFSTYPSGTYYGGSSAGVARYTMYQ